MASVIDITGLSLNPLEQSDVSKAVFEKVFLHPDLESQHFVQTGVTMKEEIPFLGRFGKTGKLVTGCKPDTDTSQISTSQKFWEPIDWGFRKEHCQADVNKLWKLFQRSVRRNELNDLTGSEELAFIVDRLGSAAEENIHRLIWFDDPAMDVVGSGGYLADALAAEIVFWKILTSGGLWPQIITAVAGGMPYFEITENSEASYDDQLNVPAGFALNILRGMWKAADSRLKNDAEAKYYVTETIYEEYMDYLEDKSLVFTLGETKDGVDAKRYRGREIVVRDDWDRVIQGNFDTTVVYDKPHRALFTTPVNIPVGTMDTESMSEVKSFFYEYGDVNVMEMIARFDVKYLENYMGVAAY